MEFTTKSVNLPVLDPKEALELLTYADLDKEGIVTPVKVQVYDMLLKKI